MNQWIPVVIVGGILLIVVHTLAPFNFSFETDFTSEVYSPSFFHLIDLRDWGRNILLFVPVGFGITGLMQRKTVRRLTSLLVVLTVSCCLSLTAEALQVFLPSRTPTLRDILSNSIGGIIGFFVFHLARFVLLNELRDRASIKTLASCFVAYLLFSSLVAFVLQGATDLTNWDPNFPLLLGNEKTGDRPWHGHISEFSVADKALSKAEVIRAFERGGFCTALGDSVVASYRLGTKGEYQDQAGHLPNLSWRGQSTESEQTSGVFLSSSHWLETTTPPVFMTTKLSETSQFTFSTTVATAELKQSGPARIVTLSTDSHHRNFTLGQSDSHLLFRLRTPLAGENGVSAQMLFPNVFSDNNFHHLVMTYDGRTVTLYADDVQNMRSIYLSPEYTLFGCFLCPYDPTIRVSPVNILVYKFVYFGISLVPLGYLLVLIASRFRGESLISSLLGSVGVLLPILILEGLLASGSGRQISVENLLMGIVAMSGGMLMSKIKLDGKQSSLDS